MPEIKNELKILSKKNGEKIGRFNRISKFIVFHLDRVIFFGLTRGEVGRVLDDTIPGLHHALNLATLCTLGKSEKNKGKI